METAINALTKLFFSRNEALIYIYLLENQGETVYQIAKSLNLSRSSIYPIMDKFYQEGVVMLENGEKDRYFPLEPEILLEKLKSTYEKNIDSTAKILQKITPKNQRETYLNLINFDAIISKAKAMLLSATDEVYINTDLDLTLFDKEFELLEKKKIRVIVFSFKKYDYKRQNIELYSHELTSLSCNRLMVVVDYKNVLVANVNDPELEWMGTFTNNPLMVRIISEHIHHDIYLLKFKQKLGIDLFKMHPDIFLHTLNEKGLMNG
ncbi:MAG: hypothetical protein KJ971_01370 [Firmicutes bacterium]|nr:hypothetical protein [Bacillota bacterium]